ncbi:oligosaccharide translocation protein RFT1 [Emericellopsis cladophorae]|uniref:Man(5)GlcNAc(2)-PP-dolichol translocation protein RFT1 n=1 Tax=Emericellopsis cladophorae TaxID=2686198 RepID=A0A9P9Y5Q8_9HYPO|nr:oligosaccharide translocation protein RFT1 [Emericellopsis cladophorae]KAI6783987.1 oligosaccharide translocation protein RFT1 [Emericellopsis cladophorae]
MVLGLISRLLTFLFNNLLVRFLTAPLLGLSTQLEVYYLSVLFFARESLRVAIQRTDGSGQAVVNLGYVSVALGVVVGVGLGCMYEGFASTDAAFLATSLRLYGLAAIVELLSEPVFVLMQSRLQFGTRALAEGLATFLRCAVTFGSAVWAERSGRDLGVLPFALGQMVYGVALFVVYLVSGYRLVSQLDLSLFPRHAGTGREYALNGYLYQPTLSLAGTMMAQSVVKHILTQGDTFLVSLLSTPNVQGVYALANNYGGLLARLLFQPIEESLRSYFSRLLTPPQAKPSILQARESFKGILKMYIFMSVVILSLGPFAAKPLLAIVAGRRWLGSGAGDVLATYCFYIPLLALNGIAEAFVASVASEGEVHRQSVWMFAFSLVFAGSAVVFMRTLDLGAGGLVAANSVNMLCRIIWSASFIRGFFARHGLAVGFRDLVPKTALALALGTAGVMFALNVTEDAEALPFRSLFRVASFALPLVISM